MAERWASDEETLADYPLQVDVQPRWKRDNLAGYDGEQPTMDDVPIR